MIFYEDKNNESKDLVSNDEGYFVLHLNYPEAMKKLEELIIQYDWMTKYIGLAINRKGNKKFIYDGDAEEISQMMKKIMTQQVEIYKLLSNKF